MRYLRRASPLHAARAAAGGAWCLALATTALVVQHPVVLAVLTAVTLAGAALAQVGRPVARAVLLTLPFAIVVAVLNPFVAHDGVTVFFRVGEVPPFGQVDLTVEALVAGGLLGLRLMAVVAAGALLTAAVDPDALLALFRRVSLRSALAAALAVRLVPVLAQDARRLDEARRCRATPVGRTAVLRAVANGALDRAIDVAATLEVRGYATLGRPRGLRPAHRWRHCDGQPERALEGHQR
ncbi:MAG: hypothetical protein HZB46_02710 [Solirubrobacterales bacterium]|nr:hypothetical protein [Solirubrobacterales bacterium]